MFSKQFLEQNAFFNLLFEFDKLEQFKVRFEKMIGIQKPTGKDRKITLLLFFLFSKTVVKKYLLKSKQLRKKH